MSKVTGGKNPAELQAQMKKNPQAMMQQMGKAFNP
jgi:hypothetical protein